MIGLTTKVPRYPGLIFLKLGFRACFIFINKRNEMGNLALLSDKELV